MHANIIGAGNAIFPPRWQRAKGGGLAASSGQQQTVASAQAQFQGHCFANQHTAFVAEPRNTVFIQRVPKGASCGQVRPPHTADNGTHIYIRGADHRLPLDLRRYSDHTRHISNINSQPVEMRNAARIG